MVHTHGEKHLADHVAIVTGAAKGIGEAIACGLACDGARVVLVDRDQKALDQSLKQIRSHGDDRRVHAIMADISKPEELRRVFDETKTKFGPASILVNNAAMVEVAEFGKLDSEKLHCYWGNNVVPVVLASQLAKDHFELRAKEGFSKQEGALGHCWIFNLSSWSAKPAAQVEQRGGKTLAYDMCAAAIETCTRGTAQFFHEIHDRQKQAGEANLLKVRVVCLAPYVFDTDLGKKLAEQTGKGTTEELAKQAGGSGQLGDPAMLGQVVCEAVGGRGKFEVKSGYVLTVDGKGTVKPIYQDKPFAQHTLGAAA
jgi:NAD(P)-dependent dehydrogenase (short-subunit alcohol dehydrogenase family)